MKLQDDELSRRLKQVFAKSLNTPESSITEELSYRGNQIKWDSILHMGLIAAIENEFDIMLETQDIIDMASFKKAKEIIRTYL